MRNISIFGLGYVGCVSMSCFSKMNYKVIGIDINEDKVLLINSGYATIVENEVDNLIKDGKSKGLIEATSDDHYGVVNSDISFICTGTPNTINGHLDISSVLKVAERIGIALKHKNTFHTIIIRSTVNPGTNEIVKNIISFQSGKSPENNFAVVSNPEFLREGSAVKDFFNPPYTVVSSESSVGIKIILDLYKNIIGEKFIVDIQIAELIKFVNNSYHALKVAFGNEIGRICKSLNIDSIKLMDLFCKDTVLNISPYYFKPGLAYGGSCLPKDLKALQIMSADKYTSVPLLDSVSKSNEDHINYIFEKIVSFNKKNISFVSITFKEGTDDVRNSPALEICERLIGKGYNIRIYDKYLNLALLTGKNKNVLLDKIPYINNLLTESIEDVLNFGDIIVIANNDKSIKNQLIDSYDYNKIILDLSGVLYGIDDRLYDGICW